jgi:hypothetical protein
MNSTLMLFSLPWLMQIIALCQYVGVYDQNSDGDILWGLNSVLLDYHSYKMTCPKKFTSGDRQARSISENALNQCKEILYILLKVKSLSRTFRQNCLGCSIFK